MPEKSYRELRREQLEILLHHASDFKPALKTKFENSGLYIGSGAYAVMLFYLPDAFTWDETDFQEKWDMLYGELRDTVSNTLQARFLNHTEVIDCAVCSLICFPDVGKGGALPDISEELPPLADRVRSFFAGSAGVRVSAAISSLYFGVPGIRRAWDDARSIMAFSKFLTAPPPVLTQKMQEAEQWHIEENVTMRRWLDRIMDGIRDSREEQIYENAEKFVAFITSQPPYGTYFFNLRIQFFFSHLMSALLESNMAHMDFVESINPVIGLTMAGSEQEFRNLLYNYLYHVWDNYREVTRGSSMAEITMIKEYIDGNISDVNLSLSAVAEKFGISGSSLAYHFKKHWDYTPTDYIARQRTANARHIIASGRCSIEGAAAEAGFGSYLTMHRAFKKYCGAAPGAFRPERKKGGKTR